MLKMISLSLLKMISLRLIDIKDYICLNVCDLSKVCMYVYYKYLNFHIHLQICFKFYQYSRTSLQVNEISKCFQNNTYNVFVKNCYEHLNTFMNDLDMKIISRIIVDFSLQQVQSVNENYY